MANNEYCGKPARFCSVAQCATNPSQKTMQGLGPSPTEGYEEMYVQVQIRRAGRTVGVSIPYDTFARDFNRVHQLIRKPQNY